MPDVLLSLGGGAGSALKRLAAEIGETTKLVAADTDAQDLRRVVAGARIQLGITTCRGLSTGGDAEVAATATTAELPAVIQSIAGTDRVILLAALGGGVGSGAVVVIAEALTFAGCDVHAIVTLPFPFEGRRRTRVAADALARLRIVLPHRVVVANEALLAVSAPGRLMAETFTLSGQAMAREASLLPREPG